MSSSLTAGSLAGKVALITGASAGIGAATARLFAQAGAKLVLHGRNQQRLQTVANEIIAAGGEAVALTGDIALEATHVALINLALKTYGVLHIAFNNAGVYPFPPLTAITSADVDAIFDTNVKGVVYGLKHQLVAISKSSSKEEWGVIINNSSTVSTAVKASLIGTGAYAASKAAVDHLTRDAALEGAPLYVRVNAINPGFTLSEGNLTGFGSEEKFNEGNVAQALIPQPASGLEIAQSVLFFADNKTGRFFTGSIIVQDGGMGTK